ncbi:ETX/MTX2 family pore-forming toxin [Bacillus cereus]|nr:ETX/MTX2 family pore-forming toxin [Bacillus cereus]
MGIPFLAEGEVSVTLEFNFSNTNTNINSVTRTISSPSQPVKVPANNIYKTEVYFEQKSTSGQVEMYADILGYLKNASLLQPTLSWALNTTADTQDLIISPDDSDRVRVKGTGDFTIEYGTDLIVRTYDVTSTENYLNQGAGKLIETKRISLK